MGSSATSHLPLLLDVLQRDRILRSLYKRAHRKGELVSLRQHDPPLRIEAFGDDDDEDRAGVDQSGHIHNHSDFHVARVRSGTRAGTISTDFHVPNGDVVLLHDHGESFRRNHTDSPQSFPFGIVRIARIAVCSSTFEGLHYNVIPHPRSTPSLLFTI